MHLVEDQRAHGPKQLARLRCEEQIERFRSRDQDVRRVAQHRLAFLLRRVARPHPDGERRLDAGQRPAQVALDVVVQGLQGRDVEQAKPEAGALLRELVLYLTAT